jgi:hypothetical protein
MHHFHSKRTPLKLRIGGIALILKLVCGLSVVPFFILGLLLVRQDFLVITLALLAAGALLSILHFALSRDVRCPLCKGTLLRSHGCSYHPKARYFLGSRRLGVIIPAILRGHFRCPYCGEVCSCTPRSKGQTRSRKRTSRLAQIGLGGILFFSLIPQSAPAAISVSIKRFFIASSLATAADQTPPPASIPTPAETQTLKNLEVGLNSADFAESPPDEIQPTLPLFEVHATSQLPPAWLFTANLSSTEEKALSTSSALDSKPVPEPRAYFLFLLGLLVIFLHRSKPHPLPRKKQNR